MSISESVPRMHDCDRSSRPGVARFTVNFTLSARECSPKNDRFSRFHQKMINRRIDVSTYRRIPSECYSVSESLSIQRTFPMNFAPRARKFASQILPQIFVCLQNDVGGPRARRLLEPLLFLTMLMMPERENLPARWRLKSSFVFIMMLEAGKFACNLAFLNNVTTVPVLELVLDLVRCTGYVRSTVQGRLLLTRRRVHRTPMPSWRGIDRYVRYIRHAVQR